MNRKLEEEIGKFVGIVRDLSADEATHFELGIGTSEFTVAFSYRTSADLVRNGVSMRNLNGEWIRAAKQEESPVSDVQQPQ